jgi:TM2 domain-containing membrane protein YozV
VIYGMIVIGALLAAESGRHETYLDTVGSALIATGLYWLAHAYASVLGHRLATHESLTTGALRRALAHDWALVRGAAIPLVVLLIAWAGGAAQDTAVTAALWSAVAGLVAFELLAAVRSRAGRSSIGPGELALEVSIGLTIGLAILALKIVLH